MNSGDKTHPNLLDFWNHRAGLGQWAGTRDVTAKQLEMEVIAARVRDGMRVLEIGCGNGITALEIARRHDVCITAVDFAPEMIKAAQALAESQELKGNVQFAVKDVRELQDHGASYDLVYTERVLINLPDWPAQSQAIVDITKLLLPNGTYAMCENSEDGLHGINALRARVGLAPIVPPWHNRYLRDSELVELRIPGVRLEEVQYYSSTYYFLSRVVNAWQAAREGTEPKYDAPINQLALRLPPIGDYGQGRLWVWGREA